MTIQQMRERIQLRYYSDAWKRKVRAMSDNQVVAIYYRLLKKGQQK